MNDTNASAGSNVSMPTLYELFNSPNTARALQTIGCILSLVCIPLYILVFVVLIVNMRREYKSSVSKPKFFNAHYVIVISMAVSDIIQAITWSFAIFPFFIPPAPAWHLNFTVNMFYLDETFWKAISFHVLLMAVYRFVVVCLPFKKDRWFSYRKTTVCVLVCWLLAFGFNVPLLADPSLNPRATWRPADCAIGWDASQPAALQLYLVLGYDDYGILLLVGCLYVITVGKLCLSKRVGTARARQGVSKYEIKLTVQQILVFFMLSLPEIGWNLADRFIQIGLDLCSFGYFVMMVEMLLYFSSPVIYLMVNSELRRACLICLGRKFDNRTGPTSKTTNN